VTEFGNRATLRRVNRVKRVIRSLIYIFAVYCAFPIFIVLLVLTLGMRDFDVRYGAREFLKNILRKSI